MSIETRAHRAADAVNRLARTTDTHTLYAEVTRSAERNSPAVWAAGLAVSAAAAIAVVVAINADQGVVVDSPDPLGTPTQEVPVTPTDAPGTDEPEPGDCSAAGLSPDLRNQPALPSAAAETRAQLAALAVSCDYEGLGALAQAGETRISFGQPAESATGAPAVAYWQKLEEEGEPVMRILRILLDTEPLVQTFESADATLATWPALGALDPTNAEHAAQMEAAIEDLVDTGLYTRDEVDEILGSGSGWLGWRVGIADDGTWVYFVAGD